MLGEVHGDDSASDQNGTWKQRLRMTSSVGKDYEDETNRGHAHVKDVHSDYSPRNEDFFRMALLHQIAPHPSRAFDLGRWRAGGLTGWEGQDPVLLDGGWAENDKRVASGPEVHRRSVIGRVCLKCGSQNPSHPWMLCNLAAELL